MAVQPVGRAHLDLRQAIQDVELGDAQAGHAAVDDGPADRHRIEPTATSGTTRGGAEFDTNPCQVLAGLVKQFRGKGPTAQPGSHRP